MNTRVSHRLRLFGTGLTIGFFALISPMAAEAQPPAVIDARERVTESIEKLDVARATGSGGETAARKESLTAVINLTVLENEALLQNMRELGEAGAEFFIAKEQLTAGLETNQTYLTEQMARLEFINSEEDIRDFASSLGAWRETNYAPRAKEAIDLVLFFRGKAALAIADARFEKITSFLREHKTARARRAEWHLLLTQAALALRDTRAAQARAHDLLSSNLAHYLPQPPEGDAVSPNRSPTESNGDAPISPQSDENKEEIAPPPTVARFVQDSLDGLKLAYAYFIKIAKLFSK